MQPTTLYKKCAPYKSKKHLDSFFRRMKENMFRCNEYLYARLIQNCDKDLVEYIGEKRNQLNEYIDQYESIVGKHKSILVIEESKPITYNDPRTLTFYEKFSAEEIRRMKQRKFEKGMIIYTPQGGKRK